MCIDHSVGFLKGQLRTCSGKVFQSIISSNATYMAVMQSPPLWATSDAATQSLFGPSSPVANFSEAVCQSNGWPEHPCCPQFTGDTDPVTSQNVCECWGGRWVGVSPQRFDNIGEGERVDATVRVRLTVSVCVCERD